MKILVTGATGFVGFHTARALLARGHAVRALVRSAEKAERVLGPLGLREADWVVGDMLDGSDVRRAIAGCSGVLHAAAAVSVTGGEEDFTGNLIGTETVLGAALEANAQALFVSSMTAIFRPGHPTNDASPLAVSKTRYGQSKMECDAWVRERQEQGAPFCVIYPSGVVGPDDPGMSESVRAYRSFLRGTLRSEGGNQMLDVRDLALLNVRLLEAGAVGRVAAGGHFFDWDGFTALLEEVTGARIARISAPGWLLRTGARLLDQIGRLTGRKMPVSGEGIEIATRFQPMEDSRVIETLGVAWRPPEETLRDLFQWFLDEGRLPPEAVPALTRTAAEPVAKG